MTYYMHGEEKCLNLRAPDRSVSGFVWFSCIYYPCKRIDEDLASQLERYAVPPHIRCNLGGVSLKNDTAQAVLNRSIHSVLTSAIRYKPCD